jgi:hypothetical protein
VSVIGWCKCVIVQIMNIEKIAKSNLILKATAAFTDAAVKRFRYRVCVRVY